MPPKQYYMLPGAATNAHFAKLSQQYQQQQQQQQASGTSPLTSSNAASPATPAANNQQAPSVSLTGLFPGSQPAGNNLSLPVSPYSVANNPLPGLSIQPQAPAYQPSSINSAPPGVMQQPVSTSQLVAPTGWSQALFTGQTSPSTNTTGPATGATTTGPTTTGPTTGSQSSGSSSSSSQKESESHSTTTPVVMNQGDIDYVKDENKKLANANVNAALSLSTMAGLGSPDYNTISNNVGYIAGTSFIPAAPLYAPEQLPRAEVGHKTQSDSYSYATAQSQSQRQSSGNGGGAPKHKPAWSVWFANYKTNVLDSAGNNGVTQDLAAMRKSWNPGNNVIMSRSVIDKNIGTQPIDYSFTTAKYVRDKSGNMVYAGNTNWNANGQPPEQVFRRMYKIFLVDAVMNTSMSNAEKNAIIGKVGDKASSADMSEFIKDAKYDPLTQSAAKKAWAVLGLRDGQAGFTPGSYLDKYRGVKGSALKDAYSAAVANGDLNAYTNTLSTGIGTAVPGLGGN